MIIECQECHARFRLDETRIKGKGARVRCRRCGESILVMKEEAAGPIGEPAAAQPAPGEFDINLAVGSALDAGAAASGQVAEGFDLPAPGQFDINRAVGEALEPLPVIAEPPPAPAADPFAGLELPAPAGEAWTPVDEPGIAAPADLSPWEAVVDAPPVPESAPPGDESGPYPFAVDGADFLVPEEPAASPAVLTETPIELAADGSAPVPPTPELDDVDLAFEQFLSGDEASFQAAAPPPLGEEPADIPIPVADDGFIDLSADATPAVEPEPAAEGAEPAPFLLNDADTLELLGNRYKTEGGETAPAEASPKEEPFPFQLDEESMAVPERDETSPFTHNSAEAAMDAAMTPPHVEDVSDAPPPRTASLPPEIPVPKSALRGDKPGGPGGRSVRPAALVGVLFLVLAGAGGYLGFTEGGRGFLRSAIPSLGPLLGGDDGARQGGKQFDIRNLIGYYDNTSKAGRMFVIKGQVANVGQGVRGSIRIHAALLDNTNRMLAEKTVYAGNVLGGEALRVADKETIETTLASPFGEGLANMDVAPGKSVPFMVVFLDIPEGIDAYRLEAKEGE